MRHYVMSFGGNEPLSYFRANDDGLAVVKAINAGAEYCVRLRGHKGPTKYTVLAIGWNK